MFKRIDSHCSSRATKETKKDDAITFSTPMVSQLASYTDIFTHNPFTRKNMMAYYSSCQRSRYGNSTISRVIRQHPLYGHRSRGQNLHGKYMNWCAKSNGRTARQIALMRWGKNWRHDFIITTKSCHKLGCINSLTSKKRSNFPWQEQR